MNTYAKIVNEETKQCVLGQGTNIEYYESHGFTKMDVEQAWDGFWYLKGYAPSKPEEVAKQEKIVQLQKYLNDTDWYVARYVDNGTPIPDDVKANRQKAREEINKLRG